MKLVANWRRVLRRAWSIRLLILAGVLSGAEVAFPLLDGIFDMPRGLFAGLSGLTVAAAFVARLIGQNEVHDGIKT